MSILEIMGGVFEVKATNGDTFLGGELFMTEIAQMGCAKMTGRAKLFWHKLRGDHVSFLVVSLGATKSGKTEA